VGISLIQVLQRLAIHLLFFDGLYASFDALWLEKFVIFRKSENEHDFLFIHSFETYRTDELNLREGFLDSLNVYSECERRFIQFELNLIEGLLDS